MNNARLIIDELKSQASPQQAAHQQRFFKTGAGQYGEGDIFLGLTSPQIKGVAKKYAKIVSLPELRELITSSFHDVRSVALVILTAQYAKADASKQAEIVKFYLEHLPYINNWDLVDISAPKIIGPYCCAIGDYSLLYELAASGHLWSERIALVANWYIVRHGDRNILCDLAVKFFSHPHDLIHKAMGWMLRELGKQNETELRAFLDKYAPQMPRTALRYALERLPSDVKKHHMQR